MGLNPPPCGTQSAALVVRDNFGHRRDIEQAYLELIGSAQGEVLIAVAYFLPGRRFRRALVDAAQRGVRVVLLVQGWSDHLVMHYASRALFGAFLDAGIEIHEHAESELHAKVAVFDGVVACVGSSNIDPFSLLLAREANLVVRDETFARLLREHVEHAIANDAEPVHAERLLKKGVLGRITNAISYGVLRLAVSLSGVRGQY